MIEEEGRMRAQENVGQVRTTKIDGSIPKQGAWDDVAKRATKKRDC